MTAADGKKTSSKKGKGGEKSPPKPKATKKRKHRADSSTDPFWLAKSFLEDGYLHVDSTGDRDIPYYTLRRWREDYYAWKDGAYHQIADDTVSVVVSAWIQQQKFDIEAREATDFRLTKTVLSNVILNLQPLVHIRETQELNSWLDGRPETRNILSMANAMIAIDPATGKVDRLEHTPNWFTTTRLPYNYDPDATCPLWEAFVDDMLGAEYAALLQQWCGYLLRPDQRLQKFLLAVGDGANGKGVVFQVVERMIGPANCSHVPLIQFGKDFALVETLGKVANITSESSGLVELEAENQLKAFTGADIELTFNRKYKGSITTKPKTKVMISTNALPRFNDKTDGTWRRIVLIPFKVTIPPERQIPDLADQITNTELPGILNWAIKGLRSLNTMGRFMEPSDYAAIIEDYKRDCDPARAFLAENYAWSPNAHGIAVKELYGAYKEYCQHNGFRPVNERSFGKEVAKLFPDMIRRKLGNRIERVWTYSGLYPVSNEDEATRDTEPHLGWEKG
ncbi:MAG TPA: phage/plasmid primase, P4 family [Sedimentisphaerales bacterium]|nr:phage/plasmid primase, P4 family [Sedimentisphaerales bacterium]HRS13203.1 phage/plasmid primase, P4 family [Sedimentisphaerales bacterium]